MGELFIGNVIIRQLTRGSLSAAGVILEYLDWIAWASFLMTLSRLGAS